METHVTQIYEKKVNLKRRLRQISRNLKGSHRQRYYGRQGKRTFKGQRDGYLMTQ